MAFHRACTAPLLTSTPVRLTHRPAAAAKMLRFSAAEFAKRFVLQFAGG
jgi:hypothetical protein